MAKIGTITFTGSSGKSYTFNVYPIDQELNDVGGVYCITRRYKNSTGGYTHSVVYVGVTGDLSTRFNDHHKDDCFTKNKANCICIHRDDNEDSRFAKESDLIDYYNPPCNG